jgi:hypothetical protein
MTSRIVRPSSSRAQVSPSDPATRQLDVNREEIIARCPDLERLCPAAVDLDAEMTAALHERINGHAVDIAGYRGPAVFREQLRALRPMTIEDVARLAIQAPADLVALVRPLLLEMAARAPEDVSGLLAEVSAQLQPPSPPSPHDGIRSVVETTSKLVSGLVADAADGTVDEDHSAAARDVMRSTMAMIGPRIAARRLRRAN